jgi:hypothetical protein
VSLLFQSLDKTANANRFRSHQALVERNSTIFPYIYLSVLADPPCVCLQSLALG